VDDVAIPAALLAFATLMIAVPAHLTQAMSRSGTLQRNRAFGIKTRATLRSDAAWSRGHAVAEPWLLAAALCGYGTAAGAALLLVLAASVGLSAVPALVIAIGGFVGATAQVIAGGVVGNSAARDVEHRNPDPAAR